MILTLAAVFAGALQTQPCVQGKTKARAECGSLRVYENRATRTGRTIRVHFIVLKARHPSGHVIYVNLGGPGSELSQVGAIADGAFMRELTALREHDDVLFVDERGFGESHSIPCDLSPAGDPAAYFTQLWPQNLLEACRLRDAKSSHLAQYNTSSAIGDLDDIRAALGYKRLIFDVGSYGTFTALLYMRAYPQNVESAVLQGVAPPGIMNLAREFAGGAQTSLEQLAKECQNDKACRSDFPHFRAEFDTVLARMNGRTMPVQVRVLTTKRISTVELSREVFVDTMRHVLYDPEGASLLPAIIDQTYHGKTLGLGNTIELITQGFAQGIDGGAFLSYTCAEVMPFTNSPDALAFARTTWFGDERVLAQASACRVWNVPAMPASFNTPVRSDAPVLMVSGTDDPATPPEEAKAQLPYLPNGALMLVRNAPHDAESPCVDRAIVAFIRADSAAGLNLNACSANFKRPPFATKLPDFLR
jgi:pimeloyl-ACP methyl ester carboxylesterase